MSRVKQPPQRRSREEVIRQLRLNLRHFVIELLVSNFAAVESVGLNSTDIAALCLLQLHGPSPAGRLAELMELTTGAVTGVVDRLEGAGFARREVDPDDRRRVIVVAETERIERDLFPKFRSLVPAARPELYERYTVSELAVIEDFLSQLTPEES